MREIKLFTCFLLIVINKSYAIHIVGNGGATGNCSESEYLNKDGGFCCNKCHPGFKLINKCSGPNARSICQKCDEGTYMDKSNYTPNCHKCQTCKPNSRQISPCKYDQDRVCECMPGYYMKKQDTITWECLRCQKCGMEQIEIKTCTEKENTECRCKENYYSVKNKCMLCDGCTGRQECKHLCSTSAPTKSPKPTTGKEEIPQLLVPVFACIMVLAVLIFFIYKCIKHRKKKKSALSSQSSLESPVPENQALFITVPPDTLNKSVPFRSPLCETEPKTLPDCVPREIKVHEFFYFVLDEVPVVRFKELVRRLGVSEQNIGWAEQDHRNYKDAQYQMLKAWSDSGNAGGNNVLSCQHIQMFTNTLKDMNLVSCADNIENKFLSQHTNASQ